VAGPEVEDLPGTAIPAGAGAEDLASLEPGEEHELIGEGTSKRSPYISSCGSSKYSPRPAAMGWPRSTTQSRSFSAASRHLSEQVVPMRERNILE
jgi:hypothetical protein